MDGLSFCTIHLSHWGFTKIKPHKMQHIAVSPLSLIFWYFQKGCIEPHICCGQKKGFKDLKSIWEEVLKGPHWHISVAGESKLLVGQLHSWTPASSAQVPLKLTKSRASKAFYLHQKHLQNVKRFENFNLLAYPLITEIICMESTLVVSPKHNTR